MKTTKTKSKNKVTDKDKAHKKSLKAIEKRAKKVQSSEEFFALLDDILKGSI